MTALGSVRKALRSWTLRLAPGSRSAAFLRPTPTPVELAEGANDLLYEVQMLFNTAALLEDDGRWNTGWGWQSKTLYMAILASFLVHARSLMDFVCPPRNWDSRVVHARGIFAADYCSQCWKPRPWPTLRQEHKQISREIQHLTLDRPPVGRNWTYADLRNKLGAEVVRFVGEADGLSVHISDSLRGILVDGVRISVADTGTPAMAIPMSAIVGSTHAGISGATSSLIDPAQVEPVGCANSIGRLGGGVARLLALQLGP